MTETYVAYGATRDLIKACTKPGEYTIPQALVKGGEIPVDEHGTHVGEAEGWWYEGMYCNSKTRDFRSPCVQLSG
jgi:cytochrome b pre-mRNA-processing protein 3